MSIACHPLHYKLHGWSGNPTGFESGLLSLSADDLRAFVGIRNGTQIIARTPSPPG
jgi:hypothetical protein